MVLNAANEVAVEAFLERRVGFLQIAEVIEDVLDDLPDFGTMHDLEAIRGVDAWAREEAARRVVASDDGGSRDTRSDLPGHHPRAWAHAHGEGPRRQGARVRDRLRAAYLQEEDRQDRLFLRIFLLGGFAKMAGMNDGAQGPDTFPAKAAWRRALIIFAGPLANILAAVAILAVVLMTTGAVTGVKPEVRQIEPNSMADRVGIQPGDRFVAVDGARIKGWDEFEREVRERDPGDEISVTVERGGEEDLTGKLGADPNNPDALVGVRPRSRTTYGPFEAVSGWAGGEGYGAPRRLRWGSGHRR